MIYFCADDYGIAAESNRHIENCIKSGALNKVSVLPNGDLTDFKNLLADTDTRLALHINLIEGNSLSAPEVIDLLVTEDGCFKYSFAGLFFLSFSRKRRELEEQAYKEIRKQLSFWKKHFDENESICIDSHQHVHMIPWVFRVLMRAIEDEKVSVEYLRIPAEPILPYIFTPTLYGAYSLTGLLKQWTLKILAFANRKEYKKSKIPSAYFMGIMFSGKLNEKKLKKLLVSYTKIAEKANSDIEIGLHPGFLNSDEKMMCGIRKDFRKFYFSPWRKKEYDALLNFKF